ncbi:MAG: hypothetical protein ACE15F_02500 [bacterium]
MKNKPRLIPLWILLAGAWPAALSWTWGKGILALWILLWVLVCLESKAWTRSLLPVSLFLAGSASVWSVADFLIPKMSHLLFYSISLFLWGYTLWLWRNRKTVSPAPWPAKPMAAGFMLLVIFGFMLVHLALAWMTHTRFHEESWSSMLWAAFAFVLCYPTEDLISLSDPVRRALRWMLPLLFFQVTILHSVQYIRIAHRLETSPAPGELAGRAMRPGYPGLARRAVLRETARIYAERGWANAVRYQRSQWPAVDKEKLAEDFRQDPGLERNLFLFTLSYGCMLQLAEGEEALDAAILPEEESVYVLTSRGRLLRLGTSGLTVAWHTSRPAAALAVSPGRLLKAVLTQTRQIFVLEPNQRDSLIDLPTSQTWVDIALNREGTRLWVMSEHGHIDGYQYSAGRRSWLPEGPLHPPLWREPGMAKAFAPAGMENTFYLLDAFGGIHWRGSRGPAEGNPYRKRLLEWYNPQRDTPVDIAFWEESTDLMMLERTGDVHFYSLPGTRLDDLAAFDSAAEPLTPNPPPVQSVIFLDLETGLSYRKPLSRRLAAAPPAGTLLVLQSDGTLQAIAMPGRTHITFTRKKLLRVETGG